MARKPRVKRLMPAGNHQAILEEIVDIRDDETGWGDRWRFNFVSTKSDPETGEKTRVCQYTGMTLGTNTNLSKLLDWMTGKTFTELEGDVPDVDSFIGQRFELTISHVENSNGEKRASIVYLTPMDLEVEEIPLSQN